MSLSKGVYIKDDCGKLKSKDSNHTILCKQNTYHMVNKNIASSKFTDGLNTKEGMPSGASISFVMTHKYRGYIVVLLISKSVEPNEEQKEMISGFQQGILCKH